MYSVQGYLIETEFFASSCLDVAILVDLAGCRSVANLVFHGYFIKLVEEVLENFTPNTLYRLRINHATIDAVGVLMNEVGESWLLFVQISKQPYAKHKADLRSLLADKRGVDGYEELLGDKAPPSLFSYYQGLANNIDNSHILYFYVSTSTCYNEDIDVFATIEDHAQGKCCVGLLNKTSRLYRECIKYQ